MNLQRIIWTSLVGASMVIASLLGAWGRGVDQTNNRQDRQIESQAVSEATHEQELKDIHEDLLRIEKLLAEKSHGR